MLKGKGIFFRHYLAVQETSAIFVPANAIIRYLNKDILRGGAVVARRAHNPKAVGSSPAPATKKKHLRNLVLFFFY
jgi:hypothetical protein